METKPNQENPGQEPCNPDTPTQQPPTQTQDPPPAKPDCSDPKTPTPTGGTPTPTPPKPTPCDGVAPPDDPGGGAPTVPTDTGCTPKDPCAGNKDDCSKFPGGPCTCADLPPDSTDPTAPKFRPLPDGTVRQLLTAIETLINKPPDGIPADATKKLVDDLKELEKEYDGLGDLITKFEADRATIECTFTTKSRKWRDEIHKLCDTNMSCALTKTDLQEIYARGRKAEKDTCCDYLKKFYELRGMQTCQTQAEAREAEARFDLDAVKALNKTFLDRLTDLEAIFKKAGEAADKKRFKTVCAYAMEFDLVWSTLFEARTWCFRRKNCCLCCPKCDLLPNTLPCWTVERYRDVVLKAIKALISAKYNRYCWNAYFMKQDADAKLLKDACDKACKTRRDRFIAEAEEAKDCPPPAPPATPAPTPTPTTPPKPTPPATPGDSGDCGCGHKNTGGMTNA
jgi:hypothetical protein